MNLSLEKGSQTTLQAIKDLLDGDWHQVQVVADFLKPKVSLVAHLQFDEKKKIIHSVVMADDGASALLKKELEKFNG